MTRQFLIGQCLNASGSRTVAQVLARRDAAAIANLARQHAEAGADYLDLCAAGTGDEVDDLPWFVQVVQSVVDVPLSLDTHDPEALRRALPLCQRPPLINSVSLGPPASMWALLRDWAHCPVVALCLDEQGADTTAAQRLQTAARLAERLQGCGVPPGNIVFDPLTLPAVNGRDAQNATLQTMTLLRERFPMSHILCAVGNYGYGLSAAMRRLAERAYAEAAFEAGADAFLCDPLDRRLMALLSGLPRASGPPCVGHSR